MSMRQKPATNGSGFHAAPGKYRNSIIKPETNYVKRFDGRVVGKVVDGTLIKNVNAQKHMLRFPEGWACDVTVLKQAEDCGASRILLKDKNANMSWEAKIEEFWGEGSFSLNRGYGRQRGLGISHWTRNDTNKVEQLSFPGFK